MERGLSWPNIQIDTAETPPNLVDTDHLNFGFKGNAVDCDAMSDAPFVLSREPKFVLSCEPK